MNEYTGASLKDEKANKILCYLCTRSYVCFKSFVAYNSKKDVIVITTLEMTQLRFK